MNPGRCEDNNDCHHYPYFQPILVHRFEDEDLKKYGVTSKLAEEEGQISREKLRLLGEVRIPLTNCGSKIIVIGLDPFNNFKVSVRLLKQGFEDGVIFTSKTFGTFVDELHQVFINLRDGTLNKINLEDYTICCLQSRVIQLIPKIGEGFNLYLAESTLLRLLEIQQFIFAKINSLERCECNFSNFCGDIVDDVANTIDMTVNNEVIITMANSKYREDLLIRELVCKFPTFVIKEIYKSLDVDDRIKPHILKF